MTINRQLKFYDCDIHSMTYCILEKYKKKLPTDFKAMLQRNQ